MLARLRGTDDLSRRWWWAAAALLVVTVPLLVSGPGNDLDVANVFRAGRSIARHADYVPSRAPGSPVHEALVGVLDLAGGPFLTNLASLAAGVALLVAVDRLLAGEGIGPNRRWAVALIGANPWFVIAATSTADYLFALALAAWAALLLRAPDLTSRRAVEAGALAGLAMGCRVGTAAVLAAIAIAELTERRPEVADRAGQPAGSRLALAGAVAAVVTVVLFIPSFVHAGGLEFARNDFATSSFATQLGRTAVKDLTLLGIVGSLVALLAVPAVVRVLPTWRASYLVRLSVAGVVLTQLLFARFPWKMPHLLPTLVFGAVLLAVALASKPRLLMALVALQVVFAVVRVDVVQPNDPNRATGGEVGLHVGWGPVVTDWRCRREHRDAYRGRQKVEVEAAWTCAKPFGG